MKLDKMWNGLKQIANGDYVLEGDLICEEDLEIELDDRLVVNGKIEVKRGIKAGCGIKAGEGINAGCGINAGWGINAGCGINAGWGINAGTFIYCEKRIFAGLSVYRTSKDCNKIIKCAELLKGEICYGELVIEAKLKPCPFCGKKDIAVYSDAEINESDNEPKCYAVCCDVNNGGCGATGGYKKTREEAAENWNKRTENKD